MQCKVVLTHGPVSLKYTYWHDNVVGLIEFYTIPKKQRASSLSKSVDFIALYIVAKMEISARMAVGIIISD